ncbi:MAG: phage major capsid protein, partial [Gammaproteobacteria bacterium]
MTEQTKTRYLTFALDRGAPAESGECVAPATLSTDNPVKRDGFIEVLDHSPGAVDLSRAPLPLIESHDKQRVNIGVVEQLRADGHRLRGQVRFGTSARAQELWGDVQAGIVRHLSVGYLWADYEQDGDVVRVTRWMPFEASVVSVPADPSAGFYRSMSGDQEMSAQSTDNSEMQHGDETLTLSRSQRRGAQFKRRLEEVEDIAAIGKAFARYGADKLVPMAIERGLSVEAFREMVLDKMDAAPIDTSDIGFEGIGLTRSEAADYSFVRAIRAQVDPKFAQREAGFELEVSRSVAQKLGREPQGLFVPHEAVVLSRGLVTGTPSAGGDLVPDQLLAGDFIELLRARTVVLELGATVMSGLQGNVSIPRQTGAATGSWITEGADAPASDPSFDQVTLTPKTVAGRTEFTRKMMLQATPDVELLVRRDLAAVLASAIDAAAINGSGTGAEPRGILQTAGIGAVSLGTDGAAPGYQSIIDLLTAVANANADAGALAFLTNSKVRGKLLATTKFGTGTSDAIWEGGAGPE